jgi:hypothetical protein
LVAKPPDLPVNLKVICQPPGGDDPDRTAPDPIMPLPPGLAGATASENQDAKEHRGWFPTIDTICPCFFELLQDWCRGWAERFGKKPAARPATPAELFANSCAQQAPESNLTCPYLREKESMPAGMPADSFAQPITVLDNLQKLEHARYIVGKAEECLQNGDIGLALCYYEYACQICPGSRCAEMAAQQLGALRAGHTGAGGAADAEEQAAPAGRTLLAPAPEPPPDASPRICPKEIEPCLPPLDPKAMEALQKILLETMDPDLPKLIFATEPIEPPHEQQEDDSSTGWFFAPTGPDFPFLFSLLENLQREQEEEDDDDPAGTAMLLNNFVPDWNQVVHDVLDAVGTEAWIDIDGSRLEHLSVLAETQLCGVVLQIYSDGAGCWQCVVVTLLPEESGDLRAAQRAFNTRTLNWILSLNDAIDESEDDATDDSDDEDDDDITSLRSRW